MFLSSAVSVLQATSAKVIVSIPPDRTLTYFSIPLCLLLLLGAVSIAGAHRYRSLMLTLAACGGIAAGMNSWLSHTELWLSRLEGTVRIEKTSLFGRTTETYPLADIRSAAVDVGADASKRIAFVFASGETIDVGDYEQRQGFESAVAAMNELLSSRASSTSH
jgi:hypothetical protein